MLHYLGVRSRTLFFRSQSGASCDGELFLVGFYVAATRYSFSFLNNVVRPIPSN